MDHHSFACLSQYFGKSGCYFECDTTMYVRLNPHTSFFDNPQLRISWPIW